MIKNFVTAVVCAVCIASATPVSADGGMMDLSTTPVTISQPVVTADYATLVNQLVISVLQLFSWTNDQGEIAFTDTNYSVQYDCNTFSGSYAINWMNVDLGTPASTRMACLDEAAAEADVALAEDLAAVTSLTFKDGSLIMSGGDTELSFTASLATANDDQAEETNYVGMTVAEAEAAADANGVAFRIGTIDGEEQAVTADYVIGRITAEVADDIVIAYTVE